MKDTMLKDKELSEFRYGYYSLFVGLLCREPSVEFLNALKEDISERIEASSKLHPLIGQGWRSIERFLSEHAPEDVADEFTYLFLGPMGPKIHPYESYYLTGQFYRIPLVTMRSFLKRVGLEKQGDDFAEPEDVLSFELEVMRWLVDKQMRADNAEEAQWLELQADFLKRRLLIWVPACVEDIEKAEGAEFYRGVAMALGGFLEVERGFFRDMSPDKVMPLEEARQLYGAMRSWKGPTFDPGDDDPEGARPTADDKNRNG